MVVLFLDFDNHIIDVGIHNTPHQMSIYFGDHSLVGSPSVLEPKWLDLVAEDASGSDERYIFLIQLMHGNLMESLVSI